MYYLRQNSDLFTDTIITNHQFGILPTRSSSQQLFIFLTLIHDSHQTMLPLMSSALISKKPLMCFPSWDASKAMNVWHHRQNFEYGSRLTCQTDSSVSLLMASHPAFSQSIRVFVREVSTDHCFSSYTLMTYMDHHLLHPPKHSYSWMTQSVC